MTTRTVAKQGPIKVIVDRNEADKINENHKSSLFIYTAKSHDTVDMYGYIDTYTYRDGWMDGWMDGWKGMVLVCLWVTGTSRTLQACSAQGKVGKGWKNCQRLSICCKDRTGAVWKYMVNE